MTSANRRRIGSLVAVPSGEIHVRIDGPADAPALVLLHGFAGSLHWWDRVAALLADRHRVVRIDLLGHGGSAKPAGGYTPGDQARMVAEVLDELGIERATVAGHSMGALVAVALAERSSVVRRLVVVGEGPDEDSFKLSRATQVVRLPLIGPALRFRPPAAAIRRGYGFAFAPGFRQASAFDDGEQPIADDRAVPFTAFRQSQLGKEDYVRDRPLDERLRDLGLPTLVLFGALDQLWNTFTAVPRYRGIPHARVEVIDTAGHSPQVETPSRVARLLSDFALAD